jgi:PAS domain S-box-containing protein
VNKKKTGEHLKIKKLKKDQSAKAARNSQESEEKYKRLFEAESDAVFLIDNKTGRILEANRAASVIYGYSRKELLGMRNLVLSAEPEETRRVIRESPKNPDNVVKIPLRYHKKKDGTIFPVELTGRFFTWKENQVHIVAIRDITDRKRAEDYLRRFEIIAERSRDIVLFMRRDNGQLVEINAAAEKEYGYSRQELLGLSIHDLRAAETQKLTHTQMTEADRKGILFETIHRRKDGSTFPVEVSSRGTTVDGIRMLVSVVRNITERKNFEARLLKSEENYRKIFEGATEGIYQTTLEGKYLNVNHAFARMFGFSSPLEMINSVKNIGHEVYVDPRSRERMVQILIDHDRVEGFEAEVYRKDKSKFWISINIHTVRDEAGNILYFEGTNVDITERKRAEEALLASAKKTETVLASITDMYVSYDNKWRFVDLNPLAEKLMGKTRQELIGKVIWKVFPHLKKTEIYYNYMKSVRNKMTGSFEAYSPVTRHWHEFYLYPGKDGLTVYLRDISKRKRAEKALRRSESRYRILYESLRDAFVQVTMSGRIMEFNDLFCRMLGYSPEEARALTYQELTPERWHKMEQAIVREQVLPNGYSEVYEKEYRRKDGTIFPVELRAILSRDEEGQPQSMWAIVRDITERKKSEIELQEYKDSLEIKSKSLEEVNIALKVLLMQGEKDRAELEKTMRFNIDRLVMPYLEALKGIAYTTDQRAHIGILESNLKNIISPLNRKIDSGHFNLTPREGQIANLIREGWASKDIGKLLRISVRAVEFHRNSLRRKLGIDSRKINLQSALSKLNI